MRKIINKIRNKDDRYKKVVSLVTSGVITLAIGLAYYTSSAYFSNTSQNPVLAQINSENSPLNVARRNISNIFESFTGKKIEFTRDQNKEEKIPALEYVPE